jgi:hypothetical protein
MKSYIGCKIIQAEKMTQGAFLDEKEAPVPTEAVGRKGYKVKYPDGYTSWSPKEAFELAYRKITDSEKELI